jgi:CRP/FNR family transcriptional regulator
MFLMDKRDVVELYPFYLSASQKEREDILHHLVMFEIPETQVLNPEGSACQRLNLVGEGSFRVFKTDSDGKEITLYHVRKGETCPLGASSMLTGCLYAATSQVQRQLKGALIESASFDDLIGTSPSFRRYVHQLVGLGVANLLHLISELAFDTIEGRLSWFLYRRFENQEDNRGTIEITHAEVASEVGYTREVVSRTLKQFEKHGTIKLGRSRIRLLNSKGLGHSALASKKKHLCNLCYRHSLVEKCNFHMA